VIDVIVYAEDPAGAFSPTLNASKPTGGSEIHAVQLCEGLWGQGRDVFGVSHIDEASEVIGGGGAFYVRPPRTDIRQDASRALVTMGLSHVPTWANTDRHWVLFNHDPVHNIPHLGHLRWSEFICVSHWQASRFPFGWKTRVIAPIVDDWIYDLPKVEKDPAKFVCVSGWWKGTPDTLRAWEEARLYEHGATLHVGSPYSHPANARDIVSRTPGTAWVDLNSPRAVVEAMRDAAAVFRVVTAPETYGVTDVIAQIVGCRVHAYVPNGAGGMLEALAEPHWVTGDLAKFIGDARREYLAPQRPAARINARDLRARHIIPTWEGVLGL
jgi:hypothetical protein